MKEVQMSLPHACIRDIRIGGGVEYLRLQEALDFSLVLRRDGADEGSGAPIMMLYYGDNSY